MQQPQTVGHLYTWMMYINGGILTNKTADHSAVVTPCKEKLKCFISTNKTVAKKHKISQVHIVSVNVRITAFFFFFVFSTSSSSFSNLRL